ncbi:MAG: TolC family protein [Ignavibacteriales bacterium]|nr:TolC family protein [Ignavibacteriales bacterium]
MKFFSSAFLSLLITGNIFGQESIKLTLENAINFALEKNVYASLILFDGLYNTSNVSRALSNATATKESYNRTSQSIIYQTHQLFLNVVRTFQLLKVSEDNLKRSKRQLERIIESNKVGAVALADVYRQQVQAGSDELALIEAQNNFEKAKADLISFIGTEFGKEYEFDFSGIPTDIDTNEFAILNSKYSKFRELVKTALENRPDYKVSVENFNSAQSGVTIARSGLFPTISASGSYGYNNEELDRLTDNRSFSVNLNLSIPIFNGFSTQAQIDQAKVQRDNADENLKQTERQIAVDVRKALLDLEAAEKQVMVSQTTVASAEMDRKIAEEKYNLGAGTLLDLLIAHANYTNALSNKVNAVNNYLLAKK